MKKPGSHGRHLHWFHMLLVLLLAGQTSCSDTSAAPTITSPLPASTTTTTTTTTAPTSAVFYFLNIAVDVGVPNKNESDIEDWLYQIFQTELESCVSSTTANETTPMTTTAATTTTNTSTTISTTLESNTTAATTSTALESNTTAANTTTTLESNTTAATTSTTLESNTTAATTSPTLESNTTTTSPTLESNTTTTSPTLESNTTAATTSTTLESNTTTTSPTLESNTTAATTSTTLESNTTTTSPTLESNTTAATTPITSASNDTTSATNLTASDVIDTTVATTSTSSDTTTDGGLKHNLRVVREVGDNVTQTSELSNTTHLFQGLELSCTMKTAITKTNCSVKLQLKQEVPPCCILRTLCAASKTFPDINVVGERVDRIGPLLNECSSTPQEKNSSCSYKSLGRSLCEYEDAFVESGDNSTTCNQGLTTCNCTDYCNKTDAYYTFHLSKHDSNINQSYILSLIYKLRDPPPCSLSSESTGSLCSLSIIATEYKDVWVACGYTNLETCKVILALSHEVPICNVSAAVAQVFRPIEEIGFDGLVTRAAICGNSGGGNPLNSSFTWFKLNLYPSVFCAAIEASNILTCENGKNTVAELEERCQLRPFTTPSPNVTATQPTTTPVNVTSPPLNTTTEPLNTTTTPVNVTSPQLNTTTEPLNTTTTTASTPTTTVAAESQANALLEQTRNISALNSSQVNQLVSQLENLLSGPNVSIALGNTSVHIVSNLLGAPAETLADSSNRIINIVDTVGLKLVLSEQAETLLSPAVALSVKPADGTNFQETFFSISDPNNVQVRGDARLRRSVRADSSVPQGSIRLPPSLTQNLTSEEQQLISRVQFNFYQRSTVFQDRSLGQRKLNSGILGASVANLSIRGLADDVVIRLRNMEPVPANFVATCVFWDFTLNDESGGWNPNGCSVQNSTDNETVCGCNHLTSFAILLDLSREPITNRLQATILTFITYIGCGVSAIFLSITLLTYLSFGKLRKDIPSKILIQLCLALLLLNLVFLVDAWLALYPEAVGLCISTAWFLHYFLLVSFTWMGLEAVHMYLALVKVFNTYVSRYMLKFSLVGWGIPMVVVIIVIAIDKDNYGLVSYGRFPDGTSDDFCWLKNDIAFYVAVVAYFCVIFLFNCIMFIMVLVQLCRIKRQNPHNTQHRSTMQDVRSVTGITLLLGLTWGFAFFAWGPVNLAFMYLFAIFNSLQGFFIFIFHCAVKENVRRQWRTYLCCGKMRLAENSDWSRTATQKTAKKSSVTRLTSLHSSNSNNSSSSTSFLVSDSSDHMNGFGNPMDDRAITADEDPGMDVILNEVTRQRRSRQAH